MKAVKDPLAPKKPPSAYFLFCSAKRAELAKASPNLKPKEVSVELGQVWNKGKTKDHNTESNGSTPVENTWMWISFM